MTRRKESLFFFVIVAFSVVLAATIIFDIVMLALGRPEHCLIFLLFYFAGVIGFTVYARNYFIKSGTSEDSESGSRRWPPPPDTGC